MTHPTPDHTWLRSILLDPSPATFAAWSDWLRENLRDEEADIAAQGRVPAVPASFAWRCVGLLDAVTYRPGSWDKRFARDMGSRLQVRARTAVGGWIWAEMVVAVADPIYWISQKQMHHVMRLAWAYRKQHGNQRLAAEARWVLEGGAPDGRGG